MTDEVIVKRLHVSGLTPALTPADLSQRFGSFGTVKALDGFGSLDGLGRPRKFGYVTLETTKTKLARCSWSSLCENEMMLMCVRYESAKRGHMEGHQATCWRGKTRLQGTVCISFL